MESFLENHLTKGDSISIKPKVVELLLVAILTISPIEVVSQHTNNETNPQLNSPQGEIMEVSQVDTIDINTSLESANSIAKEISKKAKSYIKKPVTKSSSVKPGVEQWRSEVSKYPWNVDQALSIMSCESGGNITSKNSSSTASGLFQILEGTWSGNTSYDWETYRFNGSVNIETAAHIWSHQGWSPWKGCIRF